MIDVAGLSKRFGEVTAVKDVSFEAQDGRVTGLLGPNGAGKSTLVNQITGKIAAVTSDDVERAAAT